VLKCGAPATAMWGRRWTCNVPPHRRVVRRSADALFRALENAYECRSATVQTIERRFEHIAGPIPRISDRATRVELRIEIAGNHNRGAIPGKQSSDLARLIRIHHDHEIRAADGRLSERARPILRQVEATFCAQRNGNLWEGTIAAEESGRLYCKVGKRSLKHCLQIWASTNVAVAHHKYVPRTLPARQALSYFVMAAAMQHPVGQISSRMIRRLQDLTYSGRPASLVRHVAAARTRDSTSRVSSHSANPVRSD